MITLGIDPGVRNFAVSLTKDGRVVKLSMLTNLLQDLKAGQRGQLYAFSQEIKPWVAQADAIRIERYMNRGIRSMANETINQMIGVLWTMTDMELIIPAVWKNRCNKFFDLDCFYHCVATPPHVIDATLISLYPNLDLGMGQLRELCVAIEKSYSKTGKLRAIRDKAQRVKLLRDSIEQKQ